jgi:hypothetical protein
MRLRDVETRRGAGECRTRPGVSDRWAAPRLRGARAGQRVLGVGGAVLPEMCDAAGDDGISVGARPVSLTLWRVGVRDERGCAAPRPVGRPWSTVLTVRPMSACAAAIAGPGGVEVAGRAGVQRVASARAACCSGSSGAVRGCCGGAAAWCL